MEKPVYESSIRILPDWIDAFCQYSAEPSLPSIFTTWSAISAIAASLERRAFVRIRREPLYANLYVLFNSPPGGGKSSTIGRAVELTREIWRPMGEDKQKLKYAPDDITKASLIDAFHNATRMTLSDELDSESSVLYLAADEFGTALSFLASDLLAFISKMFDGPHTYMEQRRGRGAKPLVIPYPLMNIIAGVQPGYLAQNVPDFAWEQGFLARFLLIYGEGKVKTTVFSTTVVSYQLRDKLVRDLNTIFGLKGEWEFTDSAKAQVDEFALRGNPPLHPRLRHYLSRRHIFLAKLALVAAVSRSNSMLIEEEDVQRAAKWLTEAEASMPLVFSNMVGANDETILSEVLYEMRALYKVTRQPIPLATLWMQLSKRAKAYQVQPLLALAIKRGDYTFDNGLLVPN